VRHFKNRHCQCKPFVGCLAPAFFHVEKETSITFIFYEPPSRHIFKFKHIEKLVRISERLMCCENECLTTDGASFACPLMFGFHTKTSNNIRNNISVKNNTTFPEQPRGRQ